MSKVIAFVRKYKRTRQQPGNDKECAGSGTAGKLRQVASVFVLNAGVVGAAASAQSGLAASIVVPTLGQPQRQNFDPDRFEIIVVDLGPGEHTREIIASWRMHSSADGPDIVYIPSPGPHGPAAARDSGWQAGRGDVIAFSGDDAVADEDWLKNGLAAFDPETDAVCGNVSRVPAATAARRGQNVIQPEALGFISANCFCRRRVLEEIDGFDECFDRAWQEDTDLYFRLLDYQAGIARAPLAVVTRPTEALPWGASLVQLRQLRQLRLLQFDALLYRKHPGRYRRRIGTGRPWTHYLAAAAFLLCIAGMVLDQPGLGFISGAAGLSMTVRLGR